MPAQTRQEILGISHGQEGAMEKVQQLVMIGRQVRAIIRTIIVPSPKSVYRTHISLNFSLFIGFKYLSQILLDVGKILIGSSTLTVARNAPFKFLKLPRFG